MHRTALFLILTLLAGCAASPPSIHGPPDSIAPLHVVYTFEGELAGSFEVRILPAQETLDSRLQPQQAIPMVFTAWDPEGQPLIHVVFWIDGNWTIVREDEYCQASSLDDCQHVRTVFGTTGSPPPFGIAHPRLIDAPRTGYGGTPADLGEYIVSSSQKHVSYDTPMFLNAQHFQLPRGTFHYDDDILPVRFEGLLLPFGKGVAQLVSLDAGEPMEMPPPWKTQPSRTKTVPTGLFFPGDDKDHFGIGATVPDAWKELTSHRPELVADAKAGCINTIGIVSISGHAGGIAGLTAANTSDFDFVVDGDGLQGVQHVLTTKDDPLQGRQWSLKDPQASNAYGRCPYESQRMDPVVDAGQFLSQARALPHRGEEMGMGAIYWDDLVQPFGITHERGRFDQWFRVPGSNPHYVEMDMTTGNWYRLFGHPDELTQLGAMPLDLPPRPRIP